MKKILAIAYLKSRIKTIVAFLLFIGIFAGVYALYRLPFEPVGYACLLIIVAALCFGTYDFLSFRKKHLDLSLTLAALDTGLHSLPAPTTLLESDYQSLLKAMSQKTRELSSRMDGRLSEMTDYYTLWAHQIKTPIAAMRLLLQSDTSETKGNRDELSQQLFQIEQYVGMALHFLSLESMSSDLLLCECDLARMVRQAVKKYSTVFIHKKIRVDLEGISGSVLSDEKWLTFVLEQLLSNALKYTPEGGSVAFAVDPEQEATLVITDTGIGIRASDLPRIFEKGFTGYNGRMDQKSTGIGLYLCRTILKKLGHGITISSTPGQGTTVRLDLSSHKLTLI